MDIYSFYNSSLVSLFDFIYRLNLCRKTATETRELCQKVSHILAEYLNNAPSEFYHIASAILDGLWYTDITLDKHAFLKFTYQLHGIKCEYLIIILLFAQICSLEFN